MSFWSSLGKGLLGSIPVVGPIVGGIIQGAEESKAAKTAANQQVAATDKAIALRQPYVDTGTQAFQTLGALMGLGGSKGAQVQTQSALPSTPQTGVTGPSASYLKMSDMGAISDPSVLGGNSAQAPGGGGALMGTPGQVATQQAASSYPGYTPHAPVIPQVNMRGPDGSTNSVPADQVSYWTQRGASVVS